MRTSSVDARNPPGRPAGQVAAPVGSDLDHSQVAGQSRYRTAVALACVLLISPVLLAVCIAGGWVAAGRFLSSAPPLPLPASLPAQLAQLIARETILSGIPLGKCEPRGPANRDELTYFTILPGPRRPEVAKARAAPVKAL